jgi:membrane associated rhomboid family serine protease
MSYAFGPGPITPAVRAIIIANIIVFLATMIAPDVMVGTFGLSPAQIIEHGRIWQPITYLFVHSPMVFTHILFNMLSVWMFGVDLERRWGTVPFTRFYFITGIGAAATTILLSLLPFGWTGRLYYSTTIGASGAVYGLLMAWAMLFPARQILFMFIFPMSARLFVIIIGALAFFAAASGPGGTVANLTHLGGLLVAWMVLRGPRDLRLTLRYHLTRWRMERMRRRFNLHRGGRGNDWQNRLH